MIKMERRDRDRLRELIRMALVRKYGSTLSDESYDAISTDKVMAKSAERSVYSFLRRKGIIE